MKPARKTKAVSTPPREKVGNTVAGAVIGGLIGGPIGAVAGAAAAAALEKGPDRKSPADSPAGQPRNQKEQLMKKISSRRTNRPDARSIRKILVPVDFSKRSREALRYAADFAGDRDCQLILLHVMEPMYYPADLGYPGVGTMQVTDDYKTSARAQLARLKEEEVPHMKVDLKVRQGQPFMEITDAAQELGADMIILSTHGYTGLKHVVLGSTAERVVRYASCPVLTIRGRR
jgi:universal stress protein A